MLINDKEKRIICTNKYSLLLDTYKAYDRDDDGKISKQEFFDFIRDSWITAFRLLGEKIQRGPNPYNLNLSKVNSWAQSQL